MLPRNTGLLAAWLLLVTAGQVLALLAVAKLFVYTEHGQLLDTIALSGNTIGRARIAEPVNTVLNAMSVLSLAVATAVIGFIALVRGRLGLALAAMVLVAGANVTTQILKYAMSRPDLGIDPERAAVGNSLPSGHTAVAASVAVAFVLVLPPSLRGVGGLIGAVYAALAGVATLSAGWHRPSDAVAALLVVGAWATLVSFALIVSQPRDAAVDAQDAHRIATTALALAGVALLAVAAVALGLTGQVTLTPPEDLSRRRLFVAYAGGAAGIAATASMVMALVLATAHRVVPRWQGRELTDPEPAR